ncbi:MAG: hydrogenase maturation protease [Candidatus Nanohalobium sp.]
MKDTLVLGLGNPLRGNDGAGIRAAEKVDRQVDNVDVRPSIKSGAALLDFLRGYERVFIIDAVAVESGTVGEWWAVSPDELRKLSEDNRFSHELSFPVVLDLLDKEGFNPEITFFLIGVEDQSGFEVTLKGELCQQVNKAVDSLTDDIVNRLEPGERPSKGKVTS